jgi:hypothetical protein
MPLWLLFYTYTYTYTYTGSHLGNRTHTRQATGSRAPEHADMQTGGQTKRRKRKANTGGKPLITDRAELDPGSELRAAVAGRSVPPVSYRRWPAASASNALSVSHPYAWCWLRVPEGPASGQAVRPSVPTSATRVRHVGSGQLLIPGVLQPVSRHGGIQVALGFRWFHRRSKARGRHRGRRHMKSRGLLLNQAGVHEHPLKLEPAVLGGATSGRPPIPPRPTAANQSTPARHTPPQQATLIVPASLTRCNKREPSVPTTL